MASNPIDKLIEDLEQERAKGYWEKIKLLRAQREEQKSSREAHEQRQLEYMRSAGIDLKKVERDQEEDARKLKSYLKQKRPPMISRPEKTLHFQPPAGWQAPPPTVFKPPPEPGPLRPSNTAQIKLEMDDSGSGLGWSAEATDPAPADVWFYFTPHQDASYTFTAWFAFHGFYSLYADDGWLTSCVAGIELTVGLNAFQFVERPEKSFSVIDFHSQNINQPFVAYDQILGIFTDTQDFREGEPVAINAHIEVSAWASGGGSYAELNFRDGEANYIQPLGLWVNPTP